MLQVLKAKHAVYATLILCLDILSTSSEYVHQQEGLQITKCGNHVP